MSWFQPKSSPPTLASFYLLHTNDDTTRLESNRVFSEDRNHDAPGSSGELEFNMTHPYSSKESAWAAGNLTRRIQQLISPMTSSSASFSSLFMMNDKVAAHHRNVASNDNTVEGLAGRLLPHSHPHPSFHHHISENHAGPSFNIQESSSKALTNYWQHVQFFHPRPIESQGQTRHPFVRDGNHNNRIHSFASDKENSTLYPLQPDFNFPLYPPTISERQNRSTFHNTQSNQPLNYSNTHSSSLLLPSHPFSIADNSQVFGEKKKRKTKDTNYAQSVLSRDGQITMPRAHRNTMEEGHGWDQVHLNIATYKSSSTEQLPVPPPQQRPAKKQKVAKRPIPDSNAMISPHVQLRNNNPGGKKVPDVDSSKVNPSNSRATKKKNTQKTHKPKPMKDHHLPQVDNHTRRHTIPRMHWKTFQILEEMYQLKNAAGNMESLRRFLDIVQQKGIVAWTIIFYDPYCTTPFLPMSQRYCTDKGPPCTMWNCICDKQVRAVQSSKPIAGVLFCLPSSSSSSSENKEDSLSNFFLPLGPTAETDEDNNVIQETENIDPGYERMIHWPLLPIRCDTSIKQRWDAFRSILMNKFITCVTYNAVMGLMPYHYHCLNDKVNPSDDPKIDWTIPKIWDLRLASWLLTPQSDESELELAKKMAGFAHLLSDMNIPPLPVDASDHLHGFVLAIKTLYFLNKVHPIINTVLSRNGLQSSFEEIESPLLSIISAMECHGIGFRQEEFVEIQSHVETKIQQLIHEARTFAKDDSFLLSSPQQVSHLLFDIMKISEPKGPMVPPSNTNRHRSTSEEALKQIQAEALAKHGYGYPIIDIILEFRTLNKMLTSYIRPFPLLCCNIMNETRVLNTNRRSKKDKTTDAIARIHPNWQQTAVRTGRLSCRKPNMQQIPTGSVLGLYPRSAFVPTSQICSLFAFDFSQNELRILAQMSGDVTLIQLFQSSESIDIYKLMSSAITGKPVDDVDDKERAISKQVSC